QVNSRPVLIPCRSATTLITALGARVSRTIASLSSTDQRRRRSERTVTVVLAPLGASYEFTRDLHRSRIGGRSQAQWASRYVEVRLSWTPRGGPSGPGLKVEAAPS